MMVQNQLKQKQNYNKNSLNKEIVFNKGEKVFIQNYKKKTWEKGEVVDISKSPRSYFVKLENEGRVLRRNVIHIKKRKSLLYEGNITVNKKKVNTTTKNPLVTLYKRVVKQPIRLGITEPVYIKKNK